jgi:hypothetical protein
MKKIALFLVALALVGACLTSAEGAKSPAGKLSTVTLNGKVVKKVQLREGLNVISLPNKHELRLQIRNGKVVNGKVVDNLGRRVLRPAFPIHICIDIPIVGKFCFP